MDISGEDLDTDISCDPCLIDNASENAQFYCTSCDEFLCDSCARNHRKSKASIHHQLLDRDEMPRQKISHLQDKFCAKHDGKLIEYVCDKHDIFCCCVCVTLNHVQCVVKYIDDFAKGFRSSQEYKSLLQQIKDTEKQLAEYKDKTQYDSIDVTDCFRRFKADIQLFRNEINSKMDALENELMQQAMKIKTDDLKAIESMAILCDKLQAEMSEISSNLELLEQCKQNCELFISADTARTKVKKYSDETRKMSQNNIVKMYAFSRNDDRLNALNLSHKLGTLEFRNEGERRTTTRGQTETGIMKNDMPTIGHLSIGRKEERKEKHATQTKKQITKTDIFKPTYAKCTQNINMKHNTETQSCWITGSVLMSCDTVAVADCVNCSIKIIDLPSDTITGYLSLDDKPWDITCMDPETLVVTCDTYLVFLQSLSVVKKVPMETGCSGIAYRKGKLFVTFDGYHPSVKILNREGKVLKTFKHNTNGQNLFICPLYITVNSDGNRIYVSDWNQNTVTSLSTDGNVCNIYKHDNLRAPMGLTMSSDISILVVGNNSQNIHQITPTCTPVRIVLGHNNGINYPRTVLFNNYGNVLYVNSNASTNHFRVYKLG